MRKVIITMISIAAILTTCITLVTVFVQNETVDMLNPFVPNEQVYVVIDQAGVEKDSRYEYTLDGVTENGESAEVTFTSSIQLRQGAYLKLDTKRTYVRSWVEVEYEEIPAEAQEL